MSTTGYRQHIRFYIAKALNAIYCIQILKVIVLLSIILLAIAVVIGIVTKEAITIMTVFSMSWAGTMATIVVASLVVVFILSIFPFGRRLLDKISWPVDVVEKRLDKLENRVEKIESDISGIKSELETIKNTLETLLNKSNK